MSEATYLSSAMRSCSAPCTWQWRRRTRVDTSSWKSTTSSPVAASIRARSRCQLTSIAADSGRVAATKSPDWSYTGQRRAPQRRVELEVSPRPVIARRALRSVPDGAVLNLGAALPMYDVSDVALWEGATPDTYRFSIEQGSFGGWPE